MVFVNEVNEEIVDRNTFLQLLLLLRSPLLSPLNLISLGKPQSRELPTIITRDSRLKEIAYAPLSQFSSLAVAVVTGYRYKLGQIYVFLPFASPLNYKCKDITLVLFANHFKLCYQSSQRSLARQLLISYTSTSSKTSLRSLDLVPTHERSVS